MPTNPTPAELARAFSRRLKQCLLPLQLAEVIRLNRIQANPAICHTHDFCDANEVMLDALGFACDVADFDLYDESTGRLWDEAWDIAKKAEFDEKAIKG